MEAISGDAIALRALACPASGAAALLHRAAPPLFCSNPYDHYSLSASKNRAGNVPFRTVPLAVSGLLALGFLITFATIVVLACHAHPAKDDYLSAVMFRNLGLTDALRLQYRLHNGRLFSALVMWCSPLQYRSFTGYKLECIGFAVLFAGALFLSVGRAMKRFHPVDRIAVCCALYICLHGALGNLAEFYYWLPAISCYGSAAILFMLLLQLLPAALQKNGPRSRWSTVAAGLSALAISWCCEPGAVMGIAALAVFSLHAHWRQRLSVSASCGLLAVFIAGFGFAALSPGNALRMATAPHSRGVVQTLIGALYSMSGSGMALLYFAVPVLIFTSAIFRMSPLNYALDARRLSAFLLIVGACWLSGELLAFYGVGGLAAPRVRNSFMLLAGILLFVSIALSLTAVRRSPLGPRISRAAQCLCSTWIFVGLFLPGSPVRNGLEDLVTGTARRYDSDMNRVYAEASRRPVRERFLKVSPVSVIPASLFVAQPLILKDELNGWPWLNVQMAEYFGYQRLYTDSLARVPDADQEFQHWLRHARGKLGNRRISK
jgi:hypothetical protein